MRQALSLVSSYLISQVSYFKGLLEAQYEDARKITGHQNLLKLRLVLTEVAHV